MKVYFQIYYPMFNKFIKMNSIFNILFRIRYTS